MNRLYVVESTPTITGAMADHRVRVRAGLVEPFARSVLRETQVRGGSNGRPPGTDEPWIRMMVTDLLSHRGRSVVIAGDHQPTAVHALAHVMKRSSRMKNIN